MTNLQAAVGIAQLGQVTERIEKIKKTYQQYNESLQDLKEITLFPFEIEKGEVPQWIDALTPRRDELVEYLLGKNIICRKFWFHLHTQNLILYPTTIFRKVLNYHRKHFGFLLLFYYQKPKLNKFVNIFGVFLENPANNPIL